MVNIDQTQSNSSEQDVTTRILNPQDPEFVTTEDAAAAADEGTAATDATTQRFCGTEERVSTHTCNSVHPTVAIDLFGNVFSVWHDTRDGTHEIYARALASKISQKEALDALAARMGERGRTLNLDCDPEEDLGLSGEDLVLFQAARRCSGDTENSSVLVRGENGRLDINVTARSMVLSTQDEGIDFFAAGIQPGSLLRVETGTNANLQVAVSSVIGTSALNLSFSDGATNDSGFSFSVLENPTFSLTSCETRLTCSEFTSVFPDVVVDRDGRFHVVYHSNNTGENQLYYIQLAPRNVGIKDDCGDNPPINVAGGFGEVPTGTPGSSIFVDTSDPGNLVERTFRITGSTGDFFSFGNRLMVPASPNESPFQADRTATHSLFRDFASSDGNGSWTGVSPAAERSAWDAQIAELGSSASPDVVFGSGHPLASEGDFGTRLDHSSVSFMAQTPPVNGVVLRAVSLPISPKCAPQGPAGTVELREQDLVRSPKRPAPPSFVDPVDLSQILEGPNARLDPSTPDRFMVQGDVGGTVFTNVLTENSRGDLSRLLFRKDEEKDEIKFILGQQVCGDVPCGVMVPASVLEQPPTVQYKFSLQVWQGSDYRLDPEQVSSAQMGATLIFEKEFRFDQGEEISTFVFEPGELVLPAGSVVFFVPIAGDNTEFTVEGVGGGNSIWLTSSDGSFTNYNTVPFTLRPFTGLNAPIYYDGLLLTGQATAITAESTGTNIINMRTAPLVASVAFGFANVATGEEPDEEADLLTAYAASQGFSLGESRTLKSIVIRMARGTSGGVDDDGNNIPEDQSRVLVAELFDSNNGVPGNDRFARVEIPALSIRSFDDFNEVPTDADLADLTVSFNDLLLEAGNYQVLLREKGDDDKPGRFWLLAGINSNFPDGPALWNPARPIDEERWSLLPGQVQMTVIFDDVEETT